MDPNNTIRIFENPELGQVRITLMDGEPWFCLPDVCRVLAIGNQSDVKRLIGEKGTCLIHILEEEQTLTFINEASLYRVLFQCRKLEAGQFADWVTHDVLPSIHKTQGNNKKGSLPMASIAENIRIFESEAFGQVRTTTINGEPWFVAADVCKALDLDNPRQAVSRLDEDEKNTVTINDGIRRGNPNVNVVNEAGLYALILTSRKPEAKAFKRWITHEVLPSIRKHGMYATEELLNNPDFAIATFQALKEERAARQALEAEKAVLLPKGQFYDTAMQATNSFSMSKVAKILYKQGVVKSPGRNNLYYFLRQCGVLNKHNEPYQRFVDAGYFCVKEKLITRNGKEPIALATTRVYQKGLDYIHKLLTGQVSAEEPVA